jgi:hypothetical protein
VKGKGKGQDKGAPAKYEKAYLAYIIALAKWIYNASKI